MSCPNQSISILIWFLTKRTVNIFLFSVNLLASVVIHNFYSEFVKMIKIITPQYKITAQEFNSFTYLEISFEEYLTWETNQNATFFKGIRFLGVKLKILQQLCISDCCLPQTFQTLGPSIKYISKYNTQLVVCYMNIVCLIFKLLYIPHPCRLFYSPPWRIQVSLFILHNRA